MRISKKVVIPALIALAIPAGYAVAQGGRMGVEMGEGHWRMRNASPEVLERLNEGRIAMAKAALKLTADQQKLWTPVEDQMRQGFAARQKKREEFRKKLEERRATAGDKSGQDDQTRPQRPSMAERLDRMTQFTFERAERLKAFNAVFKPFYESLSEEQKTVAEVVLREARGGRGHGWRHHHRWAMGDDMGPGMGPGHMRGPGRGPDAAPPAKQ